MAETKRVTSATDLDTSTTLDVSTLSSASRMATEPRSHVVSMKSARRIVGTVRPGNWSGLGQPSRGAGVVVAGWASGFAGGG
jgi:hypothetical protein